MGWGCYKHEMDAGSDNWKADLESITPPAYHSWGRQEEICPKCFIEILAAAIECECGAIPEELVEAYKQHCGVTLRAERWGLNKSP